MADYEYSCVQVSIKLTVRSFYVRQNTTLRGVWLHGNLAQNHR